MSKEMELELQLKEAQITYGLICDKKIAARTMAISSSFGSFVAPEGTRLNVREKSVELELESGRYWNTLARLEIRDAYDDDYLNKGYEGSYRFNSGGTEEIKFLPAMAEFITIASEKVDVMCKLFVDIDIAFGPKLIEARKVVDGIQRELSDIDYARQKAKKDAILKLMKGDGFIPLRAKSTEDNYWSRTLNTSLTMKFNWEVVNPMMIKIVGTSASGKSAKVEVSIEHYDNSTHTHPAETIRMENIDNFIRQEVALRDRVETNLDKFEIKKGILL